MPDGLTDILLLVAGLCILTGVALYGLMQAARKSDATWISRRKSLIELDQALKDGNIPQSTYTALRKQLRHPYSSRKENSA